MEQCLHHIQASLTSTPCTHFFTPFFSLSSKAGRARITINGLIALETDPYQESFRGQPTKLVVMNNSPEAPRPMHGAVTDINIWNRSILLQVRLFTYQKLFTDIFSPQPSLPDTYRPMFLKFHFLFSLSIFEKTSGG